MATRSLIVGDVHGCIEELERLLRQVKWSDSDELIFVGDLVAKGPDSKAVLDRVRGLGARSVRGNHEDHLLSVRRRVRDGGPTPVLGHGKERHRRIAENLDDADWAYLEAMPLYLELPQRETIVVHAGLAPGVPLAEQEPEHLLNMRTIRPDGSVSSRLEDGSPWATRWQGPQRVVFGHDAVRGLQLHTRAIGLDTGCVYGGELTALELPSMRLHAVSARRVHCETSVRRTMRRIPLGRPQDLPEGEVQMVDLGRDDLGRPVEVLVVRGTDGKMRAFRNLCQHIPVPLDAGARRFLSDDGCHLRCGTHGALYRVDDGFCVEGPCEGSFLRPFRLREEAGEVVLILDESTWT